MLMCTESGDQGRPFWIILGTKETTFCVVLVMRVVATRTCMQRTGIAWRKKVKSMVSLWMIVMMMTVT